MIIQIRNSDRLEPNTLMYSFVVAWSNFIHPRMAICMDAQPTPTIRRENKFIYLNTETFQL